MRTIMRMGFVVWAALVISVQAEELAIDGFSGAGELSWKDVNASGSYTIEWSPSLLQTNWSSDWSQLSQIPATGGTMRVRVPMFFRVRHSPDMPAATPAVGGAVSGGNPAVASPTPAVASTTLSSSGRGFSGEGSGSRSDPYRVANLAQLQEAGNALSGHYVLLNDLDASGTANWDGGKGFTPIGNRDKPFSGTFDGRGHAIVGLRIARFGIVTTDIALFGATSPEAQIANVNVQDAVVAGCDCVGILVGNNGGRIANCRVAGIVSGSGTFGGLVGGNAGLIERCCASVGVRPLWVGNHLGGLAGSNNGGTIRDSYATGTVMGQENPGGLVGVNNGGIIERCYACADVQSSFGSSSDAYRRGAGGLVAQHQGAGLIRDCFVAGTVAAPQGLPTGLLVGMVDGTARILNSYVVAVATASCADTGKDYSAGSTVECERVSMIGAVFFKQAGGPLKSWDFTRTWVLDANPEQPAYPRLR